MLRTSLVLIAVTACGSKSKPRPIEPLPPEATQPVPGAPTGSAVHVQCKDAPPPNGDKCDAPPNRFDAVYDQPGGCTWKSDNTLTFRMNQATSPKEALVNIPSFNGAGTYQLNDRNAAFIHLSAQVDRSLEGCPPGIQDSLIQGAIYGCPACQAVVVDADPAAPYPKPLTLRISCSSLCEEDAWICGGINVQFTQTCTR